MPGQLLVFGADSLVGSDFVARAAGSYEVVAAGRRDPRAAGLPLREFSTLDLSDERATRSFLRTRTDDAAWVNFAARTDVDGCEAERGTAEGPSAPVAPPDSAWRMNAELPGWLAEEARDRAVLLVHLSTDFVFDGTSGPYAEDAAPSPLGPAVGWYGYTKGVGEHRVRASGSRHAILRVSYPFRSSFAGKTDFARNLISRAHDGTLYPLFEDQQITPTWIPDVAPAVTTLLSRKATGTFHVASPRSTTPLEFGRELLGAMGLATGPLRSARLAAEPVPAGRAPRPIRGGLSVGRIESLGFHPTGFHEAIARLVSDLRR